MKVGPLLRQARQDAQLTQSQLAARLGMTPSTLSRYESGSGQPSLRMLDRILAGCGKQLHASLERRHADLDVELDRLAAQSHRKRACALDVLTGSFLGDLAGTVLIGGAWAAVLHGLPTEHGRGRLWLAEDDESLEPFAKAMHLRAAWLYQDGQPSSPVITPALLRRHPTAAWTINCVGPCETVIVQPGQPWPVECRLDGDLGALRLVPAERLGPEDGVRPDVLAHWLRRCG